MKQKYLLWFASVATVVMLIIALACNLTQFNDDNKSPKALLPANEMISDCLEEYTVEWYSEISSIMINNDDLLKKDLLKSIKKYQNKYENKELERKVIESLVAKGYNYKSVKTLLEGMNEND